MTMVAVWMAWAMAATGQPGTMRPARVAVVNVPVVSEQYEKTAELEAGFEQKRLAFNRDREALQQRIQRLTRALQEEFKPGTAEFERRRKELALADAELKWFMDAEGQKIEQSLAASLRSIYDDIQAAIRVLAQERGIDLVLAADQLPPEPPQTTGQARQQIVLQKVLYWGPRVDMTDDVIARLNARHKAATAAAMPPKP